MKTKNLLDTLTGRRLYAIVVSLWLIYAVLTFLTPVKDATNIYHLSELDITLIRLSFIVPYLVIWLAAAYSYTKVRSYVLTLGDSEEAGAYDYISKGILALLLSMSLSAISGALRQFFFGHNIFGPTLVIITNYLYVFPYLITFLYFYGGVRRLLRGSKFPAVHPAKFFFIMLPLLAFTYIWLDLIFTNTARYTAPGPQQSASYYLNDSLIVLTIVMPLFLAWALAFLTVIFLRHYYEKTQGIIFRNSLAQLVRGVVSVTVASVFIQGIVSLGPGRLQNLGLGTILLIIYFFLVVQGIGFAYIARGAQKLRKIETA